MALILGIWLRFATAIGYGNRLRECRGSDEGHHRGAVVRLVSETRSTRLPNEATDAQGEFVFAGVRPDTYTLEISQKGFKVLKHRGVDVAPGDRVALGDRGRSPSLRLSASFLPIRVEVKRLLSSRTQLGPRIVPESGFNGVLAP